MTYIRFLAQNRINVHCREKRDTLRDIIHSEAISEQASRPEVCDFKCERRAMQIPLRDKMAHSVVDGDEAACFDVVSLYKMVHGDDEQVKVVRARGPRRRTVLYNPVDVRS